MDDLGLSEYSFRDLEFFTEEEKLTIEPLFTFQAVELMELKVGPFRAQKPIEVPLWLAIFLKERKKCKINIPLIYSKDNLQKKIDEEKSKKKELTFLPSIFFELYHILAER